MLSMFFRVLLLLPIIVFPASTTSQHTSQYRLFESKCATNVEDREGCKIPGDLHTCIPRLKSEECCFDKGSEEDNEAGEGSISSIFTSKMEYDNGYPPQSQEGLGIGISCSLVQSAASAYRSSLASSDRINKYPDVMLLMYYTHILHTACLRSSPTCAVPECERDFPAVLPVVPTECVEGVDSYRGSEFEEQIFTKLVWGKGFGDLERRQERLDTVVKNFHYQVVEKRDIGSPFLNLLFRLNSMADDDMCTVPPVEMQIKTYYSTVQVLEDLQPLIKEFIEQKLAGARGMGIELLRDTVTGIARSHLQFFKCGFTLSLFSAMRTANQGATAFLSHPNMIPENAAPIASFFLSVVAAQLRNEGITHILRSMVRASDSDIASLLQANLPISPALQFDPRNWLYQSTDPPMSEAASLRMRDQSICKNEFSNAAGSEFNPSIELKNSFLVADSIHVDPSVTLTTKMELIVNSRTEEDLSDFMGIMGLFSLQPPETQWRTPFLMPLSDANEHHTIGPIAVIFPTKSELFPGLNLTSRSSTRSDITPNGFAKGNGGPLIPIAPLPWEIGQVLYKTAILRIYIDPGYYAEARPQITSPGDQLYILDIVSGKVISSNYILGDNGFGILEATLMFGEGVWAGGWGGGGAFAVGVRDWVQERPGLVMCSLLFGDWEFDEFEYEWLFNDPLGVWLVR